MDMDLKPASRPTVVDPTPSPPPVPAVDPFKPDPSTPTPKASVMKKRGGKGKKFGLILSVIALMAATGYGVYYWQHQQVDKLAKQAQGLTAYNQVLQAQNAKLTAAAATTTKTTPVTGNIIKITELGIQIVVPDSIKDAVYAVTTPSGTTNAYFSTTSLTKLDSSCNNTKGPLGVIVKTAGQYPKATSTVPADAPLLKQFPTFYLTYTPSQAACSDNKVASDLSVQQLTVFKAVMADPTNITAL